MVTARVRCNGGLYEDWVEGAGRRRVGAGGAGSGRRCRPGAGAGAGGRKDQGGLRLQDRGQGAGVHPAARDRRRSQRPEDWVTVDIIRPAEAAADQQDAGDHRSQPVLHDAVPRQREPVHGRLERRRHQRPLAAVLRQLLRAARLRLHPRADERHRHHAATAARMHGGPTTSPARSRSSTGSTAASRASRSPTARARRRSPTGTTAARP